MLLMDCVVTHHGDMKTHEPQVKDARDWWSPTGQKFQPPDPGKSHDYDEKQRKAA
ncbi:MAG: hypothetical protein QGG39_04365 [Candidatus Poribacteria bacterium]|nr:hypothetical protein [Candidatus Poribacteria bacterium]|tara:strand:+ start:173 stop:337 length:165 start_codon:yes stop_codon:yes gene_type:complete